MKIFLIITFSFLITSLYFAQYGDVIIVDSNATVYEKVDTIAYFPGGNEKLLDYINENLILENEIFKENLISRYYIRFTIEKDGKVSKVEPVNLRRNYSKFKADIFKSILIKFKNMPKWNPTIKNGEPIKSSYVIPITICFK